MVGADQVRVAPGAGVLARRASALLFVPDVEPASADRLLAAFEANGEAADRDDDALVDAVSSAATTNAPDVVGFVLVTWGEQLRLVVFGPTEVRTDHGGLPMLSGTGSASWVERRIRLDSSTVNVVAGTVAAPSTDLRLGCVHAGGFTAAFTARPSIAAPPTATPTTATPFALTPATPAPAAAPAPAPTASALDASAPDTSDRRPSVADRTTPSVDPTEPIGGDRLAALRAAVRQHDPLVSGDVASSAGPTVAIAADAEPGITARPAPPPLTDDEITLAPGDPDPDRLPAGDDRLEHGDENEEADADRAPFVAAIRCGRGHASPSHAAVCRVCGDLLDETVAAESIRQPPLALLELGADRTIPIDRSLVLGRQPDLDAAQAPDRARAVVISDDASVSRTHMRIDVEDWSLTVTDCGSRSGTAIVTRPGEEPRVLEPWMPHELPVGARLFLGGPASVAIRPFNSSLTAPRSRHG